MSTLTASAPHELHGNMSFAHEQDYGFKSSAHISSDELAVDHSLPQLSPRLAGPIPNPPFVFPARNSTSSTSTATATTAPRGGRRRPMSSYELRSEPPSMLTPAGPGFGSSVGANSTRSRPPPLPSFSFNPAANDTENNDLPQSPLSASSTRSVTRPGGHRRGGSEFIGGDGKSGAGLGLMSTSPTKGDDVLPSPNGTTPRASTLGPGGRRGHAHRRSAAMSCHDLSMILQPTNPNAVRGSSAPTSPAENMDQKFTFPTTGTETVDPKNSSSSLPNESPSAISPPDSPSRGTRARVGFSDAIEYIPRPLSLVSTDTASTTTFRNGHSVQGSLSSIISSGTSSPSNKDQRGSIVSSLETETRPKTAGAVLDMKSESMAPRSPRSPVNRRASSPLLNEEVSPKTVVSPSSGRFPQKYFPFSESKAEPSPTRSRPTSSASSDKPQTSAPASPVANETAVDVQPDAQLERSSSSSQRRDSISRKHGKKQKKVKSWAGSILSRKSRHRGKKALSRRSPTPPILADLTDSALNVPLDTSYLSNSAPARPELPADVASWKPRAVFLNDHDDSMSPVIDLDAALGPFNTPSHDPVWDASQRGGFGVNKKRMHSAAGPVGFHRRTESAPEMVAFDNPRWALNRFGSSSTMADVFEEDEEEYETEEEDKTISHQPSQSKIGEDEEHSIGISVVDADQMSADKSMDWSIDESPSRSVKRKTSGLSEPESDASSSSRSQRSGTSLVDEPIAEEPSHEDGSTAPSTSTPSTIEIETPSEITPAPTRPVKELAPVEIRPDLQTIRAANSPSTIYSPGLSPGSPMSYDQRVSTAPSSLDENAFHKLLLGGEPGPEIRTSVDDLPSLHSNSSYRPRSSLVISIPAANASIREGQRSASMSSVTGKKRSSIASITRLISSSHGERSKLSIEDRPPSSPERRSKKGNRLSRMMQFWKPKDGEAA